VLLGSSSPPILRITCQGCDDPNPSFLRANVWLVAALRLGVHAGSPLPSGGGSPARRRGAPFPGMLLAAPGQGGGWEPELPPCRQVPTAPELERFSRTNQCVLPASRGPRLRCWLLSNLFSQISNVLAEPRPKASQISDA